LFHKRNRTRDPRVPEPKRSQLAIFNAACPFSSEFLVKVTFVSRYQAGNFTFPADFESCKTVDKGRRHEKVFCVPHMCVLFAALFQLEPSSFAFRTFSAKRKHNVGLLRFDDDHDHICYRFAQVRIFGGKSNVFRSLQTCLQICLFLDVYKHCWVNPICAILLYILASVVCSLIPSAFSSPIKHFSELHVSCCPISFYLKIFVLINAINY
jgi:hypothetical protein